MIKEERAQHQKTIILTVLFLLFSSPLYSSGQSKLRPTLVPEESWVDQAVQHPDRIKGVRTLFARYAGMEAGDYLHIKFKTAAGIKFSLFATEDPLTYFILSHRQKLLSIQVEIVESWIPENGGYIKIERLAFAKLGALDYKKWWRQQRRKKSEQSLIEEYEKQIEGALD